MSLCLFIAGRPYGSKVFCLICVLNLLTFCDKPLFFIAGRPYSLKAFCLIWVLNLLTFGCKPLFVYGWSALWLKSVLINLGAKFACFLL